MAGEQLAQVSVRGEAVLEVDPEIATFNVTVRVVERKRDDAIRELNSRMEAVRKVFDTFDAALERRETSSMWIQAKVKGRDEKQTGYAATLRSKLVVKDLAAIGDLAGQLGALDDVTLDGPWWGLRPQSDVYRQARQAAARDAVARAGDYAAVLGATLVALIELADTGLLTEGAAVAQPMYAMAMRGGAPSEPPSIDLEPARQTVRANVEARFQMTAPPLG